MAHKSNSTHCYMKIAISELPDGEYKGMWSDYKIEVVINGNLYMFQVEDGIRGIDIPCTVIISNGTMTFK